MTLNRSVMTSARPIPSWRPIDEKWYARPLDELETILNGVYSNPLHPGFATHDMVTSVRVETSTSDDTLLRHARRAWEQMRHVHPMIAAQCDGQQYVYHSPSSRQEVEGWLDRSFVVDPGCFHNQGCRYDHYSRIPASDTPVLYYFGGEKRFVLRCPHIHADGTATGILVNDFLAELASMCSGRKVESRAFGEEVRNLPAGAIEAARIQQPAATDGTHSQVRLSSHELAVPTLGETSTPEPGRVQVLQFSDTETTRIRHRGQETGLGLTALVHAALLQACKGMTGSPSQSTHTSVTGFNLRDRCDPSLPSSVGAKAFASRVSLWPYQVQVGNYWETAKALKGEYRHLADNKDEIIGASISCLEEFVPPFLEREPPFFASFIGDISPLFSSSYGPLQVDEAWIALIPMTAMMYLVVQTFQGRLAVRLSYNEAYRSDEQVAEFLGRIKGVLGHHVLMERPV